MQTDDPRETVFIHSARTVAVGVSLSICLIRTRQFADKLAEGRPLPAPWSVTPLQSSVPATRDQFGKGIMSIDTPERLSWQLHDSAESVGPQNGVADSARSRHIGRMDRKEVQRRLLHILPGFLPLILWHIFHHDPLSWDCRAILGGIIGVIGIATALKYRRIARAGEAHNPWCILGYTVPVFSLLVLFPAHPEIGLATLAIIALGDGMATVGGLLLKSPPLPWNKNKSWAGFLCFLVFAAPWSAVIYWGETRPAIDFLPAFLCCGTATLIAAAFESLPSRIDDNIRVGVSAAISLLIAQTIVFGW